MDHIDGLILWTLDQNARAPLAEVAKKVGISKQTLSYRLKRLHKSGIIQGFIPIIDIHHLGYPTFRVYFRYRNAKKEEISAIVNYFVRHTHTLWVASMEGVWDLEVVFTARTFIHFNNIFKKMQTALGRFYQRYNISMSPICYQFRRDYLIGRTRGTFTPTYYGFDPKIEEFDRNDFRVLAKMTKDCRIGIKKMARSLGLAYQTVRQRIEKLESTEVIQGYRVLINLPKIERRYYKALIVLENLNEKIEKQIYHFCGKKSFVMYLTEVLGDWQLEVETEVSDVRELTQLLRELRQAFPDNVIDYDIVEMLKEEKINYFPMGESILEEMHSVYRGESAFGG